MTSADIDRIESLPEWARGHAYRLTFAGLRWRIGSNASGIVLRTGVKDALGVEWIVTADTSPRGVREIIESVRS